MSFKSYILPYTLGGGVVGSLLTLATQNPVYILLFSAGGLSLGWIKNVNINNAKVKTSVEDENGTQIIKTTNNSGTNWGRTIITVAFMYIFGPALVVFCGLMLLAGMVR